jgi:L-rhamnose mutarotase
MRIAFRMQVTPGAEAEYIRRHNPIWPELEQTLKDYGVIDYTIFHDAATGELFSCAEIEDIGSWKAIADTDVCRRWWQHMAPLMSTNADSSPVAHELKEIFHIEVPRR